MKEVNLIAPVKNTNESEKVREHKAPTVKRHAGSGSLDVK